MAKLRTYHAKRDFGKTAEPRGKAGRKKGFGYVIQKHDATRLHYDLRLELDGVMLSWAVTRGPSLVPGDKRLAIHVEDQEFDHALNSIAFFRGGVPNAPRAFPRTAKPRIVAQIGISHNRRELRRWQTLPVPFPLREFRAVLFSGAACGPTLCCSSEPLLLETVLATLLASYRVASDFPSSPGGRTNSARDFESLEGGPHLAPFFPPGGWTNCFH